MCGAMKRVLLDHATRTDVGSPPSRLTTFIQTKTIATGMRHSTKAADTSTAHTYLTTCKVSLTNSAATNVLSPGSTHSLTTLLHAIRLLIMDSIITITSQTFWRHFFTSTLVIPSAHRSACDPFWLTNT